MGLFDKIREQLPHELIDIIEWMDDDRQTMVYRFERYANEIKYGAKLVVREGQKAAFINEGALADVFAPGTYTLETQNLPILTRLKGWKYGFESPFKAEVYFVSTRRFTDLKWGTKNPIMLRDAEFGPVRLRAFGTYEVRIQDPAAFIREVVGTDSQVQTSEIQDQLRNMIVTRFTDLLGESKLPVLDLAANYNEFSDFVHEKLTPEYADYGIELTKFLVENISLPPAVEEALDTRSKMGVLGNMQQYTQFQFANSIPDLVKNDGAGGMAMTGAGLGMGFGMAGAMTQAFQPSMQAMGGMPQQQYPGMAPPPQAVPPPMPGAAPPPPPVPPAVSFHVVVQGQQMGPFDLNVLRQYAQGGQVTKESLVWRQGMSNWQQAGQVPELQALFAAPPPPPPMPGGPPPVPGS